MNDNRTMADTSATEGRRSLLKKAAVVGGVAWVAPTLLSQVAVAQGTGPACIGCSEVADFEPIYAGACGEIYLTPESNDPGEVNYDLTAFSQAGEPAIITCVQIALGGTGVTVHTTLPTSGPVDLTVIGLDAEQVRMCVSYTCP